MTVLGGAWRIQGLWPRGTDLVYQSGTISTTWVAATVAGLFDTGIFGKKPASQRQATVVYGKEVPQASYAAGKLGEALTEQRYDVRAERTGYDYLVSLALHPVRLGKEAFSIIPEAKVITVYGGDNRGLIYGAKELGSYPRRSCQ